MGLAFDADYGPLTDNPFDPRNGEESGWEGCFECKASGHIGDEPCEHCHGQGGWTETEPMTYAEFQRREQRERDDRSVD